MLEARRLLTATGASVTAAAFDVGYESSSQFSREYARKFGVPPSRDVASATL
ncbi:MAG TPA: AraC family transcriptional regulator [Polyangiaceae bacterium]|nr:AraC family transcriptional regulator [Polyangiaceae bacterium]